MRWLLIEAGCAECIDSPLIHVKGVFLTAEAAKAAARNVEPEEWEDHPDGGFHVEWGSGGCYVVEVSP